MWADVSVGLVRGEVSSQPHLRPCLAFVSPFSSFVARRIRRGSILPVWLVDVVLLAVIVSVERTRPDRVVVVGASVVGG